MSEKIQMVNVKLGKKLLMRRGGLVDPGNGIAVSFAKTDRPEGQRVPRTGFIAARLHSGELIEVKAVADTPGKETAQDVKVTFKEKCEVIGKKYKAGDEAMLPATTAMALRDEGKVL